MLPNAQFRSPTLVFLHHNLLLARLAPVTNHVTAVCDFLVPSNLKQLQWFSGMFKFIGVHAWSDSTVDYTALSC
jgi:hypothetical protein